MLLTSPSCTKKGYTSHLCGCGESFVDSFISATDHSFLKGNCTVCGETDPSFGSVIPTVLIESANAEPEKTFSVSIFLRDNPGIVSFEFSVIYDTSILELLSAVLGDYSGVSYAKIVTTPFIVNWVYTIYLNNDTDKVVSTLTFRVKDNAVQPKHL